MENNGSMKRGQTRIMHLAHKIHKIKLLYTKFNAKKSWTLNLMGERCQNLKLTIFQLERECTSSRTIGIRLEFILTTARWITVLSVAKLLYQLLFKLSGIPVGMVRVVCWLESRIYKYSPCLKLMFAQTRCVSVADILSVSLFEFVWFKNFIASQLFARLNIPSEFTLFAIVKG